MKFHYAGIPGEGFGWGVCNKNLISELGKRIELCGPENADVVFMPLADHEFNPISPARGKINLAYTFFEYPLGPNAAANAAKYDIVFAGSTWCIEQMKERGITNTRLLIQGVDHEIFQPAPGRKPNGQFRIFSGGKFEYRKGQDLVITAFKEFSQAHPEAHLVCSWFNPWPQLITATLQQSGLAIDGNIQPQWFAQKQETIFAALLMINGLRYDQFTVLPQLGQRDLALWMTNTDCGLFPNRCEGGTNLVLTEYLSCGRPAAANVLTGHYDLIGEGDIRPIAAKYDRQTHWANQDMSDIMAALENCYHRRQMPRGRLHSGWWDTADDIIISALTELKQCSTWNN